ncbi:MAG: hypothetical protein DWI29_01180 [Planctomycetota bacterium]|nr:MAG: hypothetical protein DWI29_01180 [Planctomycetota bacterium]
MASLRRNKGLQAAKPCSFSTLDCLQMQELPKCKDFESIFCRIDGANPDLPPDPEPVLLIMTIVTRRSLHVTHSRLLCQACVDVCQRRCQCSLQIEGAFANPVARNPSTHA